MRYTPLGWAKKYEFTESDLKVAADMLDIWIDGVAMVCLTLLNLNLTFPLSICMYLILEDLKVSKMFDSFANVPWLNGVRIDTMFLYDSLPQGRTNLPPEKVPWDAIRTLLAQCIYGGKIDNDFDQVSITCVFTSQHFHKIWFVGKENDEENLAERIVMIKRNNRGAWDFLSYLLNCSTGVIHVECMYFQNLLCCSLAIDTIFLLI